MDYMDLWNLWNSIYGRFTNYSKTLDKINYDISLDIFTKFLVISFNNFLFFIIFFI